jgi:hypothetical protein
VAELILIESDQADPAGRFRLRAQGGKLLLEKKTNVGATWTTWSEIMEVDTVAGTVEWFGTANP